MANKANSLLGQPADTYGYSCAGISAEGMAMAQQQAEEAQAEEYDALPGNQQQRDAAFAAQIGDALVPSRVAPPPVALAQAAGGIAAAEIAQAEAELAQVGQRLRALRSQAQQHQAATGAAGAAVAVPAGPTALATAAAPAAAGGEAAAVADRAADAAAERAQAEEWSGMYGTQEDIVGGGGAAARTPHAESDEEMARRLAGGEAVGAEDDEQLARRLQREEQGQRGHDAAAWHGGPGLQHGDLPPPPQPWTDRLAAELEQYQQLCVSCDGGCVGVAIFALGQAVSSVIISQHLGASALPFAMTGVGVAAWSFPALIRGYRRRWTRSCSGACPCNCGRNLFLAFMVAQTGYIVAFAVHLAKGSFIDAPEGWLGLGLGAALSIMIPAACALATDPDLQRRARYVEAPRRPSVEAPPTRGQAADGGKLCGNLLLACACLAALFAPSISQRLFPIGRGTRSVCAAGTCGAYWQAGGRFGYQLSVVCTWCATLIAWAFVCRAQGPQVVGAAVACGCLLVSIVSTHVAGNTGGNDAANSTDTWFGAGWYFQIVAACLAAGLALVGCRALPSRRDQSGGGAAALSHVLRPAFQPLPPPTVVAVEMLAVRAAAPAVADILNLAPEAGDDEDDELPVNRTAPRTVARLGAGGQRAQV